MKNLNVIFEQKKRYGLKYAISIIANFFLDKMGLYNALQLHKEKIYYDANALFRNQVAYGLFKGMKISNNVWWGKYDALSKYLGQYEPHILCKLKDLSKTYDHFVDIGAADGYYAIGLLHSSLYKTAACFEISARGRQVINENAALNGLQANIKVLGEATYQNLKEEIDIAGPSVVLCDIEGAEYDLFSKGLLDVLHHCHVIIELHDDFLFVHKNRRKQLIDEAKKYFEISFIGRTDPKSNQFEELRHWSDDLRQLAFSEGRPSRMEWLLLTPLNKLKHARDEES